MQDPLRILVAEPPENFRARLLTSLAQTGLDLDLRAVSTAEQALAALGNLGFDCALIDTRIAPDGDALLRAIDNLCIDTPIIIITEAQDGPGLRLLLQAGAADCMTAAELSGSRLTTSLYNAVRMHRARRRLLQAERTLAGNDCRDALTRLPNRAAFLARAAEALQTAANDGAGLALFLIDLNGFQQINQTFGNAVGDRLLAAAADRLRAMPGPARALARVGDDEFALLLPLASPQPDHPGAPHGRDAPNCVTPGSAPDVTQRAALPPGAIGCASRVLAALRRPIAIDGQDLAIDAAIGISFYPAHGDSADALWRAAQAALFDAKRTATGYVVHAGGGGDRPDHLTLGQDLHQAAQNNEFELHYQPVIGVRQRRVVGVEALVRWRHPRFGLLFPDAFVPLAEQIGAIDPMTDWVLGAALQQLCAWQKQGHDFTIAVNVSALTLRNSGFPVTVERLLGQWRVRPDRLVLEVTESAIIQDTARAVEIINRLHAIGVVVSIDDFGTGYTSLAYLRKLPVQELKIDKSFIKGLRTNSDDAIITRTIIELGHNLGLRVVAEGVEDSETFDMLDDLGCDVAQGYHMSRPVDAASLRGWLATSAFGDNRAPGGKAALGGKRGAPQVRDASGAPADENAAVPGRRQPRKKAANRHKTARAASGAKVKDAARKKSRRWRVKPAANAKG